jgi:hypothetical protein
MLLLINDSLPVTTWKKRARELAGCQDILKYLIFTGIPSWPTISFSTNTALPVATFTRISMRHSGNVVKRITVMAITISRARYRWVDTHMHKRCILLTIKCLFDFLRFLCSLSLSESRCDVLFLCIILFHLLRAYIPVTNLVMLVLVKQHICQQLCFNVVI